MTLSQHTYTATLADSTVLDILDGWITVDDRWSPYVQGELTIATPSFPEDVDPRNYPRVDVVMTQRFGPEMQHTSDLTDLWGGQVTSDITAAWGGLLTSDILALFDRSWNPDFHPATAVELRGLWVRSRNQLPDGQTRIGLASTEAILQDLKFMNGEVYQASTLRALIREVALFDTSAFDIVVADGLDDTPVQLGAFPALPDEAWSITTYGQSYLDLFTPLLQQGDLRLWCDLDGTLRITSNQAPLSSPGTDVEIVTSAENVIDRDRDDWADAVVIEYDPNPNNSGYQYHDRYAPPGYSKVFYLKVNAITPFTPFTPDPEPDKYPAELAYDRLIRRGHVMDVQLINDYSIRPRTPATLDIDPYPLLTGTVEAITWNLGTAIAALTTRELEEV